MQSHPWPSANCCTLLSTKLRDLPAVNKPSAPSPFASKYGPWGIVAGASEGLGAAFAAALAARGLNVLLLARRVDHLLRVADEVRKGTNIEVRTEAFDLARADLPDALDALTANLDIGLAVYNAAHAPVGEFVSRPVGDLPRVIDVNIRGPLVFARTLAPTMVARGRGGIVLMSSLAGYQGAPRIATYAASKAFNIVLGESLWAELKPHGVDVVVSTAGAIRTPGYAKAAGKDAPGTLDAKDVANQTLDALGKGPVVVPGAVNRIARFALGRLIPRRTAIGIFARSTKDLA
ncbi:MAG: SDR family NAD(P)-dependent oxidoreductase [Alphaproteobacteria bacterium]|nr:SDR family NAD(P)-dependent oxidoreductase [Alphaproteobacteria bacterium]